MHRGARVTGVTEAPAASVIDAAGDLIRAAETLHETIAWADRQVSELEARWADNRVGRRTLSIGTDPNGRANH